MNPVQFDWDEAKAVGNLHKHGISFELASSVSVIPGSSPSLTWSTS
jgi:uncharacterized DUF497 family protein